jgi:hypothetical protein
MIIRWAYGCDVALAGGLPQEFAMSLNYVELWLNGA